MPTHGEAEEDEAPREGAAETRSGEGSQHNPEGEDEDPRAQIFAMSTRSEGKIRRNWKVGQAGASTSR